MLRHTHWIIENPAHGDHAFREPRPAVIAETVQLSPHSALVATRPLLGNDPTARDGRNRPGDAVPAAFLVRRLS